MKILQIIFICIFFIALTANQSKSSSLQSEHKKVSIGQNEKKEYIRKAKDLFIKHLNSAGGLLEIRIEKVNFISTKLSEGLPPDQSYYRVTASNEAFQVEIIYSLKPVPEKFTYWTAGNGRVQNDGWITSKVAFVTIDKVAGEWIVVEAGTGL